MTISNFETLHKSQWIQSDCVQNEPIIELFEQFYKKVTNLTEQDFIFTVNVQGLYQLKLENHIKN